MEHDYPAIIVGAGPAGARAAELLARAGVKVLLVERGTGSAEKVCGGLLNRQGQAALGCGLPQYVRRDPYQPPLEYHDRDNQLHLRYASGYWNMRRKLFDAWLRERAADAGARLGYGVEVLGLAPHADGVRLYTSTGELRARCVLDATGWRALSRKSPAPDGSTPKPLLLTVQGRIQSNMPHDAMWAVYDSSVTPFYGWIIPQGGGEFLLGYGAPAAGRRPARSTAETVGAWAPLWPYMKYIQECGYTCEPVEAKPRGCPLVWTSNLRGLWWGAGGVHAVGEAAGLVSPSSGGGIHYALEHAAAVAQALLEAGLGDVRNGASPALEHHAITARTQALLAPQLARLRFSCLKAWTAAQPRLRGWATHLLPYYTHSAVQHLPWR